MNNRFSVCFDFPFERFGSAFGLYVTFGALTLLAPYILSTIVSFIVAALLGATLGLAGAPSDLATPVGYIVGGLVMFLFLIPTFPFYPAFFRCLETKAQGAAPAVGNLFAWRGLVGPSIVAGVLVTLIWAVPSTFCSLVTQLSPILGLVLALLFLIPALLLMPLYWMVFFFVARGASGTEAIASGFRMLTSNPKTIFYTWGFMPLILMGYVTCCIGLVVSFPMFMAAMYFMMRGIPTTR